jgi:hypothetical protein
MYNDNKNNNVMTFTKEMVVNNNGDLKGYRMNYNNFDDEIKIQKFDNGHQTNQVIKNVGKKVGKKTKKKVRFDDNVYEYDPTTAPRPKTILIDGKEYEYVRFDDDNVYEIEPKPVIVDSFELPYVQHLKRKTRKNKLRKNKPKKNNNKTKTSRQSKRKAKKKTKGFFDNLF